MSSDIKLCEYRFGDGNLCKGIALRGADFCRHHLRYQDQFDVTSPDYRMPSLEDANSVQLFVNEVLRGLLSGKLDPKHAKSVLWGAMIASANLKQVPRQRPALRSNNCQNCDEGMRSWVRDIYITQGEHAGRNIGDILDAGLEAREDPPESPSR